MAKIEDLIGKVLVLVERTNDDLIAFTDSDGVNYQMWHEQDCCESVCIEDINGNLSDLIGSPILMAVEVSQESNYNDASQWTFYHFATIKGYVTVRWYGNSNGYYSTSVTFN